MRDNILQGVKLSIAYSSCNLTVCKSKNRLLISQNNFIPLMLPKGE